MSESGAAPRLPGGGGRGGFLNLRQYEEEVNKLKKDNLSLRLRIYLLEERHGLLPKARQDWSERRERAMGKISRLFCYRSPRLQ